MIKLAQLLCPQRHCFMAVAFDAAEVTEADACIQLRRSTAKLGRLSHGSTCALCGSRDFSVAIGATRFATMDEAMPRLVASMAAQLATRSAVISSRLSEKGGSRLFVLAALEQFNEGPRAALSRPRAL
jgi:hypothetical protein